MTIYYMRHGQSQSNANKVVTGKQESKLTSVGQHQSEHASNLIKDLNIGLIVCSPLERAKDTAKIIANQIGYPDSAIIIDPDLTERALGELENKSYAKNPRMNGNFPETETVKGIESLEHLHARLNHFLKDILPQAKHKNILIVCHMNVGRMLQIIANGQKPTEFYDTPRLENARVHKLIDVN
ncbi:MAG TPA: histidine phosphatase family protein [Candidatus Saccharimonadales bacterium]|nr:histidine phosphatase family protein [Candidatus Saccharimonadales bacterium]